MLYQDTCRPHRLKSDIFKMITPQHFLLLNCVKLEVTIQEIAYNINLTISITSIED